jgi:enoyl-CoA hydratase/carnithine racemase
MARFLSAAQGLEALPVPTVAVVHGLNLTIGMELSLAWPHCCAVARGRPCSPGAEDRWAERSF